MRRFVRRIRRFMRSLVRGTASAIRAACATHWQGYRDRDAARGDALLQFLEFKVQMFHNSNLLRGVVRPLPSAARRREGRSAGSVTPL